MQSRNVVLLVALALAGVLAAGPFASGVTRTAAGGRTEDSPTAAARSALHAPDSVSPAVAHARASDRAPAAAARARVETSARVPEEGRNAGLSVRIRHEGSGTPAVLELLDGLEAGRVLRTDASGTLEARLYPGLVLVRVSAAGLRLERELVLRPAATACLELETSRRVTVRGRVLDAEARPLSGARVALDGVVGSTDGGGAWSLECVASGAPLLRVEHAGYAARREALRPPPEARELVLPDVVLVRGAELELAVRGAPPGESVSVHLLPRGGQPTSARGAQSAFPWYRCNPTAVEVGTTCTLRDLPAGRMELVALHALASARSGIVCLRPGERARVELELVPVPRLEGRVLRAGTPVPGARVVLESANRARASASLPGAEALLACVPLAELPAALQTTWTDRAGAFVLGDWGDAAGNRYLSVTAPGALESVTLELPDSTAPRIDLAGFE